MLARLRSTKEAANEKAIRSRADNQKVRIGHATWVMWHDSDLNSRMLSNIEQAI